MQAAADINYRKGKWVAMAIVALWLAGLGTGLQMEVDWANPLTYLLVLAMMHLYTGLFITAHDAMHGAVSRNKRLNDAIGTVCALLVAFNWYPRLRRKHFMHHNEVATATDPDFHQGGFLAWYFRFLLNYITWYQLLLMAVTFNLLMLVFPEVNIALYWMIPAILSTLQLFYFGTYLPHRGQHAATNPHKARSQGKGHVWAFFSCYFFGYHYEHHDKPWVPWWKLYADKR